MRARWYQCKACGAEFWTPRKALGPDNTPRRDCWLCRWLIVRFVMYVFRADSAASPINRTLHRVRRAFR